MVLPRCLIGYESHLNLGSSGSVSVPPCHHDRVGFVPGSSILRKLQASFLTFIRARRAYETPEFRVDVTMTKHMAHVPMGVTSLGNVDK